MCHVSVVIEPGAAIDMVSALVQCSDRRIRGPTCWLNKILLHGFCLLVHGRNNVFLDDMVETMLSTKITNEHSLVSYRLV